MRFNYTDQEFGTRQINYKLCLRMRSVYKQNIRWYWYNEM